MRQPLTALRKVDSFTAAKRAAADTGCPASRSRPHSAIFDDVITAAWWNLFGFRSLVGLSFTPKNPPCRFDCHASKCAKLFSGNRPHFPVEIRKSEFNIAPSVALESAVRSRATARTAIGNLRWFNEYCEGTESKPDKAAIGEAFALKDVDCNGLTKLDRAYLAILSEATSPLGISTIESAVGENEDNLLQAIEPFLIRKGYVRKTGRGRVATPKAIELITGRAALCVTNGN